ncbi:MAG: hypothetical protein NTU78_13370 [Alphaproteobacteria bacterium]|nr:hypothetical protein [Alphaproteobacteria bacterium]
MNDLLKRGWVAFPQDSAVLDWIAAAGPAAQRVASDPGNEHWFRHGRTWFAGVNALPNDTAGSVPDGPAFTGAARSFLASYMGTHPIAFDNGQVSVCYPGYPQAQYGESDAAVRFRRDRDAAHVDGLIGEGEPKRRFLREPHAFVLGIPLCNVDAEMSPLVVWEGSHEVMRAAFLRVLSSNDPKHWPSVDLTDAYTAARREVFSSCVRVEVCTTLGQCYVLHRLALHGVAPWGRSNAKERPVIYFRPLLDNLESWLGRP